MTMPLPSFDSSVRLAIQRAFIDGRPTPTPMSIARDVGAGVAEVSAAFDRLADGRVIVLTAGTRDIMMSAPFAAKPTDFTVTVAGRAHYANCIWDALGVAAMMNADADVGTRCGDCELPLAITVRNGAASATPAGCVAHFAVPAAHWWPNIVFT